MPTSSITWFPELISDAVALLSARTIPEHVLQAEIAAEDAAARFRLCRTPQTREAREVALSDLARANKVLAAWNPRLIVTPKAGAR